MSDSSCLLGKEYKHYGGYHSIVPSIGPVTDIVWYSRSDVPHNTTPNLASWSSVVQCSRWRTVGFCGFGLFLRKRTLTRTGGCGMSRHDYWSRDQTGGGSSRERVMKDASQQRRPPSELSKGGMRGGLDPFSRVVCEDERHHTAAGK